MSAAPRLEELIARLPGSIRRGNAVAGVAGEALPLSTGIEALDRALGGGLPRGRLSELVGPGSGGGTSLAARVAALATARAELVAWIDAADAFDPESAAAVGVELERLLWIRPPDLAAAFSATEQLLVLGGFTLVVLDAGGPPLRGERAARALPVRRGPSGERSSWRAPPGGGTAITWLRLSRAAARSRSTLVVLRKEALQSGGSGSFAVVRLELAPARALWDRTGGAPFLLDGLLARVAVKRNRNRGGSGECCVPIPLR